ncbi:hypothetical protein HPB50_025264 [Hyalomma asiaticum]|uniref:Uncharacterized protein n=1 Tax=Hyalomma asiaticum TaxID=266040 RepID=A0ACB7SEI3_HYAAI|nr:hypothetical protein HPB50_025264 [Hyalomma asiaticum]
MTKATKGDEEGKAKKKHGHTARQGTTKTQAATRKSHGSRHPAKHDGSSKESPPPAVVSPSAHVHPGEHACPKDSHEGERRPPLSSSPNKNRDGEAAGALHDGEASNGKARVVADNESPGSAGRDIPGGPAVDVEGSTKGVTMPSPSNDLASSSSLLNVDDRVVSNLASVLTEIASPVGCLITRPEERGGPPQGDHSTTGTTTATTNPSMGTQDSSAHGQPTQEHLVRGPRRVTSGKSITLDDLHVLSRVVAGSTPSPVPAADKGECVIIGCTVVTAIVVLVCIATVLLRSTPKTREPVCMTESCTLHAKLLTSDLDTSIDPCRNFSAYVCSGWFKRRRTDYLHFSKSLMDDVRQLWFPGFSEVIYRGSQKLRAGLKPMAMYSSCMGHPSQYGSDLGLFRKYMDAVNLSWPEAPKKPAADVLVVLLTLAFQWQVPLWLRIREAELIGSWRFSIDPGPFLPLMRQHHLSTKQDEYIMYWMSFYIVLSEKGRHINKSVVEAVRIMEHDVLEKLYAARTPAFLHPIMLPVSNMGSRTPPLTSDRWLHALEHLSLDPIARPKDTVLLSDTGFFETLGHLFGEYSNEQLLDLIGWSFVQLCAPAADYRLLVARYGSETAATKYKPYFCERFIESSYSLLVVAMYSVARLSRLQRDSVDAGFDSLVWSAAALANATTWLDVESRQLAAEKMASTQLVLWPPNQYLENDTILEELYETFPSKGKSFADYWVTVSQATAAAYKSLAKAGAFGYAVNYALPYHHYDGPLGKVKLPVGAVTTPLFYEDGTKAMFYGGLGFLMALSLVRAVDSEGLRWHPDGTFGESFLSRDSTAAFADKDACLNAGNGASGRRGSVFPEVPAVEVAYAAYRAALDERPENLGDGLTGDKVFFMTLCFMTCARDQVVDCNKAVSNFAPFARAFGCSSSSAMNPERKCSFFG